MEFCNIPVLGCICWTKWHWGSFFPVFRFYPFVYYSMGAPYTYSFAVDTI